MADFLGMMRQAAKRFAQSVHVEDEVFRAEDDGFHLPPGVEHARSYARLGLRPRKVTAPSSMMQG